MAAVCFLFTLAIPTAALTVSEDRSSDDIVLEPTSRYADLNGDDELELDFDGFTDETSYLTHNVFEIHVGDGADNVQSVWIDHDVAGVTFYEGGDPQSEISPGTPLELAPGDTASVGVLVNTHIVGETSETFTVVVQYEEDGATESSGSTASPTIEASNLNVSPTTLETGATTTVNATYRNFGETETVTPRLTVDGTVVDQRSIDLEPGETETVSFERRMDWPGTYDVGIAGVGTEAVTVEGPPIDVVDATIDDAELTAGESTAIRATVRNPTETAVDRTLEVAIDGIVVDSRAVTIPANDERAVVFERRFDETGTYGIEVSGVDAGTVTVDEPATFSIRNRELSAATTAAIAPPATAGLLFLAMAANRRWAFVR